MKILVVHEVSYLRKIVYEIHEFPELLSLRGNEVTFLDFDEAATRKTRSRERVRQISGRIHKDATLTLATPHAFGIHQIDRLWAMISGIPLLIYLFRKKKFDVVLNYAVPTYGLQVILLAHFFRVPVIHRALDVSSKIRVSVWNPLISFWERAVFRFADRISANNPAMLDYVADNLAMSNRGKVELNYPPLDLSIFKQTNKDWSLAASLGIETSDKVIMYMGSFFYFSGIPNLIRSLEAQFKNDASLKLLLIGGGEQDGQLRQLVSDLGLSQQVIFTGFVSFHDLPKYMSLGDVAVNPLEDSLVASAAFPHKVLQYMAVGLPVVSTRLHGLLAAFGETSGITWVPNAESAAKEAINLLRMSPERLSKLRKVQQAKLEELFSISSTVDSLESCLSKSVRERGI